MAHEAAVAAVGAAAHDAEPGEPVSIIVYGRTTVTALSDVYPGCPVAGFDDGEVVDVFDEYGEPYARLSVGWALESASTGEQVEIFVAPS